MKYKTTIRIMMDAENKNEATEIVGEYLSGNIISGVDMRCQTKRVYPVAKGAIATVAVTLLIIGSVLFLTHMKPSQTYIAGVPGIDAVQPPLKTSTFINKKDSKFKDEWQKLQMKAALDRIKK